VERKQTLGFSHTHSSSLCNGYESMKRLRVDETIIELIQNKFSQNKNNNTPEHLLTTMMSAPGQL